jgi:hypothetical protein
MKVIEQIQREENHPRWTQNLLEKLPNKQILRDRTQARSESKIDEEMEHWTLLMQH